MPGFSVSTTLPTHRLSMLCCIRLITNGSIQHPSPHTTSPVARMQSRSICSRSQPYCSFPCLGVHSCSTSTMACQPHRYSIVVSTWTTCMCLFAATWSSDTSWAYADLGWVMFWGHRQLLRMITTMKHLWVTFSYHIPTLTSCSACMWIQRGDRIYKIACLQLKSSMEALNWVFFSAWCLALAAAAWSIPSQFIRKWHGLRCMLYDYVFLFASSSRSARLSQYQCPLRSNLCSFSKQFRRVSLDSNGRIKFKFAQWIQCGTNMHGGPAPLFERNHPWDATWFGLLLA